MVAMKVRSCALILCMVIVPGLALFSHLTPPAACEWFQRVLRGPWREAVRVAEAPLPVTPAGSAAATPAAKAPERFEPPLARVTAPPVDAAPRVPADAATLQELRTQLATLGATAIDCRPQPGDVSGYASSCRIGIDPSGQLHRMFHGHGVDASAALQSLVAQVRAWHDRQAGQSRQRL